VTRGDDGSVSLYVVLSAIALFAAFGLVADGGNAITAKGRAISHAYAAARAGAEAMVPASFATSGTVTTDPTAARAAALRYLSQAKAADGAVVDITGQQVRVRVTLHTGARVLSMFGLLEFTVTGEGSATAVYGVEAPS
jgi:hypothetical protein